MTSLMRATVAVCVVALAPPPLDQATPLSCSPAPIRTQPRTTKRTVSLPCKRLRTANAPTASCSRGPTIVPAVRRALLVVLAVLGGLVACATADAASAGGRGAPLTAINANFVGGETAAERVASYRRLHAAGVRVVRIDFNWMSLEPVGPPLHDYQWGALDREVRTIRRAGLKVLAILAYGHPDYSLAGGEAYWSGQQPVPPFGVGDPQYYPPDDPDTFARFAGDVADRYRRDVWGWEVWNEENEGWRFWAPREDPAAYGRLLCAAHRSLRNSDDDARVALGGMFFPPFIATGAVSFLDQVLTAGGPQIGRCFDAVGYHPYPYPFTSPESVVADRGSVISAATQLRDVLERHGLADKPLWNTEVGWPTSPNGNGVTEARQARFVARLALLSWARDVPVITWYTWGDYTDPSGLNQEAHFGLFRDDGSAKPSFRALTNIKRLLGGRGWRFAGDQSRALGLPHGVGGVNRGYALSFRGPNGRRLLALWYANEQPPASPNPLGPVEPGTPAATISVRVPVTAPVKVTNLLGAQRRPRQRSGQLRLSVGQDPVFVTWRGRASGSP